jgi:hypothetical protein
MDCVNREDGTATPNLNLIGINSTAYLIDFLCLRRNIVPT